MGTASRHFAKAPVRLLVAIDHSARAAGAHFRNRIMLACRQNIAAQNQISLARWNTLCNVACWTFSTIRICEVTEPFFCDIPVMSSTDATLPSRCAAMPSKAPTVITPVPPIPFKEYCRKYRSLAKSAMEFHRNHPFRNACFRLHWFAAFHCDEAWGKPLTQE